MLNVSVNLRSRNFKAQYTVCAKVTEDIIDRVNSELTFKIKSLMISEDHLEVSYADLLTSFLMTSYH